MSMPTRSENWKKLCKIAEILTKFFFFFLFFTHSSGTIDVRFQFDALCVPNEFFFYNVSDYMETIIFIIFNVSPKKATKNTHFFRFTIHQFVVHIIVSHKIEERTAKKNKFSLSTCILCWSSQQQQRRITKKSCCVVFSSFLWFCVHAQQLILIYTEVYRAFIIFRYIFWWIFRFSNRLNSTTDAHKLQTILYYYYYNIKIQSRKTRHIGEEIWEKNQLIPLNGKSFPLQSNWLEIKNEKKKEIFFFFYDQNNGGWRQSGFHHLSSWINEK